MPPPESGIGWGISSGSKGCLTDQAGEVAGAGEDIGQDGGFGAVGQAVPGGVFDATAPLIGVAALSVAQAPDAQFPRGRADLEVTSETDIAIWEGTIDDDGTAARKIWMLVGTIGGDKGEDSLGVGG